MRKMPYYMYVSASGEDKIKNFIVDPQTGKLESKGEVVVIGSPANLVIAPSRDFIYVARKGIKEISTFRRNLETGDISFIGTMSVEAEPGYLAVDKKGKYLFATYFWMGQVAVYPINNQGIVTNPPLELFNTAKGVHSVQTDPSNQFVFYPHIAVIGPNLILQFKFNSLLQNGIGRNCKQNSPLLQRKFPTIANRLLKAPDPNNISL